MEIICINNVYKAKSKSVIALGNFDGVHIGHKELLKNLVNMAKEKNIKSSILVFKNHTKNLLAKKAQNLITSNRKKYEIFENMGIDIIYEIAFTKEIMHLEPEYFVENFLKENLLIEGIVVGYDYKFGYKAKGDTKLLKELSDKNSIDLIVVDKISDNGEAISSTRIRNLIKNSNIKKANQLLGYNFSMDCLVVHGKKLGSKMGYPTANLELLDDYIIPKFGVYDSNVIINNKLYKAVTNIGKNPTIENSGIRIESNIIDFNQDIYGQKIELILLDYIRSEKKFDSIDSLFEQIKKDRKIVEDRFL